MGPTPPGTGVMYEAFFETPSKSTSPTNWPDGNLERRTALRLRGM
jgi:hypothetical protein